MKDKPLLLTTISRPLTHSLLLLGVLFAAGGGSLFVLLSAPPTWSLDVGTAGDTRFLEEFFPPERSSDGATGNPPPPATFRWSRPEAHLLLYGLGSAPAALSLRLHHDASAPSNHSLRVQQGEQTFATIHLAPGWRTYRTLLPADTATSTGFAPARLTLLASPSPAAKDGEGSEEWRSDDERSLGIPVDRVAVAPLLPPTSPVVPVLAGPVVVGRTLLLLWGVAVLAGVLWLINRALEPQHPPTAALTHLQVQLVGAFALLAVWAWHDPVSLAWVWSEAGWVLVPGTVALGGVFLGKLVLLFLPFPSPGLPQERGTCVPLQPGRGLTGLPGLTALAVLVVLTALAHLLLFLPLPVVWRGGAAWCVLGLPGALLALRLVPADEARSPLVRLFLGLCGGLALAPLLLLLLHALPGPVPGWALLLACDVLSVGLAWPYRNVRLRWPAPPPSARVVCSPLLIARFTLGSLVLVGICLRLACSGCAEFQGDEGQAMIMAARLVHGQDDILYLHRKGPMEVLLPALPLALTHHITEWVARLPFTLAGVGILGGSYLLGSRLFRQPDAGLLAAAILSLEGFMLGFSRIVQYQNIVLLMTLGALWCCWRFFEGGNWRLLLLAAWLVACGLLAHYDGIFGLPAMAWLVVASGIQRGWRGREWVRSLGGPLLVGVGLLALFYLPFVLHEQFVQTLHYLLEKRIGGQQQAGIFTNNLGDYSLLATFYNPTFLVHTLALLLAGGVLAWLLWGSVRPRPVGWGMAVLLLVGCVLLVAAPGAFRLNISSSSGLNLNWALAALGLPLAALVLSPSPSVPLPLRVVVLWFGGAFLTEAFVVADPKTHFYTMLPAAALLMGLFIVQAIRWFHRRRLAWVLSPLVLWGAAVAALTVPYLFIVFVRQVPEYERTFPDARPPIYLASYGDHPPERGFFGFPHRDGWKVVGELYRRGVIGGSYDSNQKSLITLWYIRHGSRAPYGTVPTWYFAARSEGYLFVPEGYHLAGTVVVDGKRMLDMYRRGEKNQPVQTFHLRDFRAAFDAQPVPNIPIQPGLFDIIKK